MADGSTTAKVPASALCWNQASRYGWGNPIQCSLPVFHGRSPGADWSYVPRKGRVHNHEIQNGVGVSPSTRSASAGHAANLACPSGTRAHVWHAVKHSQPHTMHVDAVEPSKATSCPASPPPYGWPASRIVFHLPAHLRCRIGTDEDRVAVVVILDAADYRTTRRPVGSRCGIPRTSRRPTARLKHRSVMPRCRPMRPSLLFHHGAVTGHAGRLAAVRRFGRNDHQSRSVHEPGRLAGRSRAWRPPRQPPVRRTARRLSHRPRQHRNIPNRPFSRR